MSRFAKLEVRYSLPLPCMLRRLCLCCTYIGLGNGDLKRKTLQHRKHDLCELVQYVISDRRLAAGSSGLIPYPRMRGRRAIGR